jgi:hypothetical protein
MLGDVLGPPDGRAGSAMAAPAVTGVEGNGEAGAPRLRASRASRTDRGDASGPGSDAVEEGAVSGGCLDGMVVADGRARATRMNDG